MYSENNFERIVYAGSAKERQAPDIVLPTIYADKALIDTFLANEFDITFDSGTLVNAANDLGLTNHVQVVLVAVSSLAKNGKPVFFPSKKNSFSRDTVFVAIETAPQDRELSTKEANLRLFTAILASNLLDQPATALEEMEKLSKGIRRKALKKKIGGGALTATGIATKISAMTGKVIMPSAVAATVQLVGFTLSALGRRTTKQLERMHIFSEHFEDRVIERMIAMATVLRDEYPIIDYTVETPKEGIDNQIPSDN
jgi:hypothetical protein